MKKKVALLTMLMVGMCQVAPAYAADAATMVSVENDVMPAYELANSIISSITKGTGGKVTCKVRATVQDDQTGTIEITMKLQQYVSGKWETLKTWNDKKTGTQFNYSESTVLDNTSNLRLSSTTKITVAGKTETVDQIATP